MYYINVFFIYSIIGYIFEYIMYLLFGYKGGILYGCWTPIYGVGSVIILYIYNMLLYKLKKHKIIKFLYIFFSGLILLTFIEFIGGSLVELIFHKNLWDYSKYKFNIGKHICLEMSLMWGTCSLILVYILKDFINKIIKKIPKYITWILIILFITDLSITIFS